MVEDGHHHTHGDGHHDDQVIIYATPAQTEPPAPAVAQTPLWQFALLGIIGLLFGYMIGKER